MVILNEGLARISRINLTYIWNVTVLQMNKVEQWSSLLLFILQYAVIQISQMNKVEQWNSLLIFILQYVVIQILQINYF